MVETVIIGSTLIMLVFGALQFALIYHAKTTLNYATFEAARSGALNNARMTFIENAFVRGMAALYTHDDSVDDVRRGRCVVRTDLYGGDPYGICQGVLPSNPPTVANPNQVYAQIEMLNPRPEHFQTSNHGIDVDDGFEIPNDSLMYRPDTIKGGVSIQDANLLKIRVTYCYPLYVPLVNETIVTLLALYKAGWSPDAGDPMTNPEWSLMVQDFRDERTAAGGAAPFPDRCLYAEPTPRIPLNAMAIVRMQSPAFLPGP